MNEYWDDFGEDMKDEETRNHFFAEVVRLYIRMALADHEKEFGLKRAVSHEWLLEWADKQAQKYTKSS